MQLTGHAVHGANRILVDEQFQARTDVDPIRALLKDFRRKLGQTDGQENTGA